MLLRILVVLTALICVQPLHALERLKVVATFAPIYSLTVNVVGNAADVSVLLPGNTGPHGFALSPKDLKKMAAADVIVANGAGVEEWLDKAMETTAKTGVLKVIASERIASINNPHIWLDPIMAITMVETIRDALMARDKQNAASYQANAANYIQRLQKLHADVKSGTENLAQKKLLTYHNSLECFAQRYGFEIVGSIEPFPGREPTPKYLKQLRSLIVAKRIRALFSEPQYSPRILERMSEDLQIPIATLDPMETGVPSAELYERVMRKNLEALTTALGAGR